MARPRKMTVEQMISVVDSYYYARAERNEKRMKCSLIAAYAVELGYQASGYDFARNLEVREHIERMKCWAEVEADSYQCNKNMTAYKTLDVAGFIRNNKEYHQLVKALTELDAYWKRVYEHADATTEQNKKLMREKAKVETVLKETITECDNLKSDNAALSRENNKLIAENRYLRKMLRTYLYPAVANEILLAENELTEADVRATDKAIADMTEFSAPLSLHKSVTHDLKIQSEEDSLLSRMWGECDDDY
jgi:regulator of replication initiation timing